MQRRTNTHTKAHSVLLCLYSRAIFVPFYLYLSKIYIMATLYLSLSKNQNEFGRSEILIRFSVSRTIRPQVKSGIFIPVNRWSEKRGEISLPKIDTQERKELVEISYRLNDLKKRIFKEYESTEKNIVSKYWLIDIIENVHTPAIIEEQKEESIFEAYEEYFNVKKLSSIREKNSRVVLRSLKRFELYNKKSNVGYSLRFSTINETVISEFESFLFDECKLYERNKELFDEIPNYRKQALRGQNSVSESLTRLRSFFKWCVSAKKINVSPFDNYKIKECVYGSPIYPTIEERDSLLSVDLTSDPELSLVRYMFLLQSMIGCRVGDYYKMKNSNIIDGCIEYIARKTKDGHPVTIRVPLLLKAKMILEMFYDPNRKSIMPFVREQDYNEGIKKVFELANITRMVTVLNPTTREPEQRRLCDVVSSHMARRCFIGNIYKKVKDQNLISPFTGHKEGSRAFARYREIDDNLKREIINLIE